MKLPTHILKQITQDLRFVPASKPVLAAAIDQLQEFVDTCSKLCVLTGAGISTESGVPDYRSKDVGLYARINHKPITYQEFTRSKERRQRYWARNYAGWPHYKLTQPNVSHRVLAEWEAMGKVSCLITQNVDSLHTKAGSEHVVELHGSAYRARCLACHFTTTREALQERFDAINKHWDVSTVEIAPDADSVLTDAQIAGFRVPPCQECGGDLMPDMTFFGDNVPMERVDRVYREVEGADGLLIVGSSLYVYSGWRFVRHAIERHIPVAIVNIGETRADKAGIHIKVDARIGEVLPQIIVS